MNIREKIMVVWFVGVSIIGYLIYKERSKGDNKMTKICSAEGCNNEIQEWQDTCPKHYAIAQQQKQASEVKKEYPEPPQMPEPQPQQMEQPKTIDVEPEPQPQPVQQEKVMEQPKLELPQLNERERLIVKQTSMKCAIDFMQQAPVEYEDYNDMVAQLKMLTLDIYGIIVRHNER